MQPAPRPRLALISSAMLVLNLCTNLRNRRRKIGVENFYRYQNYLTECHREDEEVLSKSLETHNDEANREERASLKWDKWLARITLFVNVLMIAAKIVAAYLSHSLSIVSSVVDSAMDITSGAVVWICVRAIQKTNRYDYPIGRNRLEPLAVIIVAILMIMANLILVGESVISTVNGSLNPRVDLPTLIIMCTGTVAKSILFLFCRRQKSANAKVLALDQRNDVITNLVALAGAYVGHRWWKYADPLGACLVCGFIIWSWLGTAREQIPLLVGKAASPEFINRIVRIAIGHDDRVKALDTIIVYHLGANFLVELHVVMDPDMVLRDTHDVSETLQVKLEKLPFVERAFVHCDYKYDGDEHI